MGQTVKISTLEYGTKLHAAIVAQSRGKVSGIPALTVAQYVASQTYGSDTFDAFYHSQNLENWRLLITGNAEYKTNLADILDRLAIWEKHTITFELAYPAIAKTGKSDGREAGIANLSATLYQLSGFHPLTTEADESEASNTLTPLELAKAEITKIEGVQSAIVFCNAQSVVFPQDRILEFFSPDANIQELHKLLLGLIVEKIAKNSDKKEKSGSLFFLQFESGLTLAYTSNRIDLSPWAIWKEFAETYSVIRSDELTVKYDGQIVKMAESDRLLLLAEQAEAEKAEPEKAEPQIVGLETAPIANAELDTAPTANAGKSRKRK